MPLDKSFAASYNDGTAATARGAWPAREDNTMAMPLRMLVGAVLGGLLGYALYRFVGCASGACPITSNPWVSTIVGMAIGTMAAGSG